MKLLNCLLAQIANAGYFQQYASLTAEERESRRVLCDSKVDETRAAFPVENGSWVCPGYGKTRSKVRCHPTCGQGYLPDWTEKSISKPKKDAARFMARCGDPATIVRKNLPVGMELKCSPKPAHPCFAKAETIAIPDGRLELANKINKKRATYQVVCEDGTVSGQVHCFRGVVNNPKWNRDAWKSSCVGKTTTVAPSTEPPTEPPTEPSTAPATEPPTQPTTEAATTLPPCANNDPCDGLASCQTFINGCEIAPVRNNQLATVSSAFNYKFSADVLCDLYRTGNWENLFQVTRGNNAKNLGDRTFGLWKRSGQDTKLHLTVTDPADLSQFQYSGDYECAPGEWATFSVEVRQEEADPSTIRFTTKMGETQLHTGTYAATEELKSYDLQVFVANNFMASATGMLVRNFYYQTFEEIPI